MGVATAKLLIEFLSWKTGNDLFKYIAIILFNCKFYLWAQSASGLKKKLLKRNSQKLTAADKMFLGERPWEANYTREDVNINYF